MNAISATPLLDLVRQGDVSDEIRLLLAEGQLAPRAMEQLGLLLLLVKDPDSHVARAADRTLSMMPRATVTGLMGSGALPDPWVGALQQRGLLPTDEQLPADLAAPLIDPEPAPAAEVKAAASATPLPLLPVMQRLKLAMKGTREQRSVLIRDPHKVVAVAVLSSPKLTITEVESFARMANVSSEVLRLIGTNRVWTKNYAVTAALARNPKTPPVVSLALLPRLVGRDLKLIAADRNVPDVLRQAARRFVATGESRRH